MIAVRVAPRYARHVDAAALRTAAQAALTAVRRRAPAALTVVVTGDARLRALNRQFRGVDAATDVLSFPADDPAPVGDLAAAAGLPAPAAGEPPYLGDVILSYPRAAAQAAAGGHGAPAELQLLVVHGVLHLLGYDHANAAERRRMWAVQACVLRAIGAAVTAPKPPSQAQHD
jgi:probable rRNA maturation factor